MVTDHRTQNAQDQNGYRRNFGVDALRLTVDHQYVITVAGAGSDEESNESFQNRHRTSDYDAGRDSIRSGVLTPKTPNVAARPIFADSQSANRAALSSGSSG